MIFISKNADFSAKYLGKIDIEIKDDTEYKMVQNILFENTISVIRVGKTFQFTATAYPEDADDRTISWSCGPTDVATIDNYGILTPKKEGTVIVTARAVDGSGVRESFTVNVEHKTEDDFIDITQTTLNYYSKEFTDAEKIAIDDYLVELGANENNSIYSKLKCVIIPCLGKDLEDSMTNFKDGLKLSTVTGNSGAYSAENLTVDRGGVVRIDTSIQSRIPNMNGTHQLMVYSSTTVVGGTVGVTGGGSETSQNYYNLSKSNIIGPCALTTMPFYAKINQDNIVRGFSLNGWDNYTVAPINTVTEIITNGLETLSARTSQRISRFLTWQGSERMYFYAIGLPMTSGEMETFIISTNKLLDTFNVVKNV